MTRTPLAATVFLAALAAPAQASVMPTADFQARQLTWALSAHEIALVIPIPAASLDYGLSDNLAVGAVVSGWSAAGRMTARFYQSETLSLAFSGSGGLNFNHLTLLGAGPFAGYPAYFFTTPDPDFTFHPRMSMSGPWFQPALNATWRPGGAASPFALRAMFGPVVGTASGGLSKLDGTSKSFSYSVANFLPNLELAWRLNPGFEFTLGGNGLMSVRGRF